MNKETEDVLTGDPGERWLFQTRNTGSSETKDKFPPYPYPRVILVINTDQFFY